MTSTQWVEYHVVTKRKSYNTLPTSDITAETVSVDGFTLSQTDNAGVTTTADRMVTLTTFRAGTETVSTDPSDRTDGDITTWSYHNASGMETAKTYADGSSVVKTYDAENRPVSFTNAESRTVVECAYDHMGRRATKKVTIDGSVTLHQRYLPANRLLRPHPQPYKTAGIGFSYESGNPYART